MNDTDRRKLETELIRSGFKGINDPELVPEMARLIPNHEVLRALLNECSILERGAMLDAIRPHLSFEAHPVDWYEERSAEKFEAYENQRNRMIVGDREFERVTKELASHALIKMQCSKCTRSAEYLGDTPPGAVILARQDGWVREKASSKEVCPKCECVDRTQRRKCPGCSRRHYAPPCRVLGKVEAGAPLIGGAKKGELDVSTGMVN